MELNGKIILIGETETVGNNGFTKRQLVIESLEQYPQTIPIDFVKDKTSILDKYNIGETVKVSINIRGNEYNGKYYVNLHGWRIEKSDIQGSHPVEHPQSKTLNDYEPYEDDLPF